MPRLACRPGLPAQALAGLQGTLFTPACSRCHPGDGGSDFSDLPHTYEATVGRVSRYAGADGRLKVVAPGDLAASSLWLKVLGGSAASPSLRGPGGERVGEAMPRADAPLGEEALDALEAWICGGGLP